MGVLAERKERRIVFMKKTRSVSGFWPYCFIRNSIVLKNPHHEPMIIIKIRINPGAPIIPNGIITPFKYSRKLFIKK
jgi:hypothetical protein